MSKKWNDYTDDIEINNEEIGSYYRRIFRDEDFIKLSLDYQKSKQRFKKKKVLR